ncbi:MAG: RNA-binding S4 domain-containing protein [Synergistaceae bacterium]|jgi:ribosomal 50S subunit-recycling heat shock protein|nr:RNA-binding S4 domain-containing protein [Synergistaceae bacterium]
MRIDKFLKMARLVKRRTAAQEMIEVGAVRIDGRVCRSSAEVTEGKTLEIAYMARVLKVKVLCADEQLLKRPQTVPCEVLEERRVDPDEKPWQVADE